MERMERMEIEKKINDLIIELNGNQKIDLLLDLIQCSETETLQRILANLNYLLSKNI